MSAQGRVLYEGDMATMMFERQLQHPPEEVWKAVTDPEQLRQWYMTTGTIEGRVGGQVDTHTGPARFHVTGKVLAWDPPRVYEHEWNVDPREELPKGERAVVRWELAPSNGGTLLTVTHRRLTVRTATGFAPGMHAFLDRLAAHLGRAALPDWMRRMGELQPSYPPMAP